MKRFPLNLQLTGLLLIGAITLNSCSDNDLTPEPEVPSQHNLDSNLISLDEVLQNAENHFKNFFTNTRSSKSVKSVEIKGRLTRSAENSALYGYYLVNYGEDNGFALLSADRRRRPVIAISNNGAMHFSDTLYNIGLRWYLKDALERIDSLAMTEGFEVGGKPGLDSTYYAELEPWINQSGKKVHSEPLLKSLTKFHQGSPYNKYCFTLSGEQAVVGCTALAVGTVMGYNKWPLSYIGYTFNWNTMYSNFRHDNWSRLFEVIGRSQNLNSSYGTTSTGAAPSRIPLTFTNMGYKGCNGAAFSSSIVDSELEAGQPVICSGYLKDNQGGHSWVIDGGYTTWTNQVVTEKPGLYYESYYHCVWGWGGSSDGYFLYESGKLGGRPKDADLYPYISECNVFGSLYINYGQRPNK